MNLYEFVKSVKDVLGIDFDIDKARILLSRINYKVTRLGTRFNGLDRGSQAGALPATAEPLLEIRGYDV